MGKVHEIGVGLSSSAIITLLWWASVNLLEKSYPFLPVLLAHVAVLLILPVYDRLAYPHPFPVAKRILRISVNLAACVGGLLVIFFGGLSTKVTQPTNAFQMLPAFVGITSMICGMRCVMLLISLLIWLGTRETQSGGGDQEEDQDVIRRRRLSLRSIVHW